MWDLFKNPDHVPVWEQALEGQEVDWDMPLRRPSVDRRLDRRLLFSAELAAAYPDAIVVLSVRDPDEWWPSVRRTMVDALEPEPPPADTPLGKALAPARRFNLKMLAPAFTPEWTHETEPRRHSRGTTRRSEPPSRRTAWSNGGPATAGARSAPRSDCPSPPSRSRMSTRPRTSGRRSDSIPPVSRTMTRSRTAGGGTV